MKYAMRICMQASKRETKMLQIYYNNLLVACLCERDCQITNTN